MNKTEEEAIKYAEAQASVFMFPSDKEAGIAKIKNKFGFMAGAEWQKERAIEAFRQIVEDYCAESGRKDIVEDSEHYIKVFNELITNEY